MYNLFVITFQLIVVLLLKKKKKKNGMFYKPFIKQL